MASRDDDEFERRRQQIIDGALAVFSAKGFDKATNQEIAEAAGIGSPGLIYHYFENKADLLRQLVASRSPALQSIIRDDALRGLAPREALTLIGSAFLSALSDPDNRRLFRVMMAESLRNLDNPADWHHFTSIPARRMLAGYLESQMQAGLLRPMNPVATANCFLGPLVLYILSIEVFSPIDTPHVDRETMLQTVVATFLDGAEVV